MTQDTDIRQKGRAVFLAALMVLSVFAMTAAFAGSATAQAGTYDGSTDDLDGELFWQGQEFVVENLSAGDDVQIRRASDNGLERERTVDGNGTVTISTSDLEGIYYLQGAGADTSAEWEVAVQELDASFADEQIGIDGNSDLTISSDRASFDVTITTDDDAAPADVFGSATHNVSDGEETIPANFTGEDPGTYNYTISVDDTDASADVSITVLPDVAVDASFTQGVFSQVTGDVVDVTLDVDGDGPITVNIGDEAAVNYEANLVLENLDDAVTITFNTYHAGNASGEGDFAAFEIDGGDLDQNASNETELPNHLEVGDYEMSVEDPQGEEQDVATLILTEPSIGDSLVGVAAYDAALGSGEDIRDATTEGSDVAEGDHLVFGVEANGIFAYLNESDLGDGYLSLEITQTNPGPNQAALSFSDDDAAVSVVGDSAEGLLYVVVDVSELDGARDVVAGQQYDISLDFSDSPYHTDEAEGSFDVVDRTIAFDDDEVVVQNVEDAQISGTSSAAEGTEVRVRARAGGDNPFLKTQVTEVDEDGTWTAEFDMSDANHEQEFDVRATLRGPDDVVVETTGVATDDEVIDHNFVLSNMEMEEIVEYDDNNPYVIGTGTVTNEGDEEATAPVGVWSAFFEDFIEGAYEEVTLGPGESVDMEFYLHPDTSSPDSEYDLHISTLSDDYAFTIEVVDRLPDEETPTPTPEPTPEPTPTPEPDTPTPTEEPEDTPTETPEEEQPGFGLVVALIALIAAALLAVRRRA